MQRRDFLRATTAAAATGLVAQHALADNAAPGDAAAKDKALEVQQVETDRFRLVFSPADARPLRVLQLTDTHFGSQDIVHKGLDRRTFEMITKLVDQQRPDLVVHNGDFINNDQGPKISFEAVDFMDGLGVPWTHALGNHDIGAVSTEDYRKKQRQAAFGYFDADGKREYAFRFDVVAPGSDKPGFTIYCFDSGFRMPQKHVSAGQLAWFERQQANDREQGCAAPAIAMIHIPIVEFKQLHESGGFRGIYGEKICHESDTGQTFAAFKKSGRLRAIFSGHDHKNDYCGHYDGIELVYGRVSGWAGYGALPRGGRLIELDPATGAYSHRLVFPTA